MLAVRFFLVAVTFIGSVYTCSSALAGQLDTDMVKDIPNAKMYIIREYAENIPDNAISRLELSVAISGFSQGAGFAEGAIAGYLNAYGRKVESIRVNHFENDGIASCEMEGLVNEEFPFKITISNMKRGSVHAMFNVTKLSADSKAQTKMIEFDN